MVKKDAAQNSLTSLSRRKTLTCLGGFGVGVFGAASATSATGEPMRPTTEPRVSPTSDDTSPDLKSAERPVWAVQQTDRREVNSLVPFPVEGGVQSFLNVYYLGAEWHSGHWRHQFVMSGIGYSWNDDMSVDDWFENSTDDRPIVIEASTFGAERVSTDGSDELLITNDDGEGQTVDAGKLKKELKTLEYRDIETFFTALKNGSLEAGDVTRHDTITSIYYRTDETDDTESILARAADFVGIDRITGSAKGEDLELDNYGGFEYPVTPEPSTVQAHHQRFEVRAGPNESGTIKVASGFKPTYPTDEWISNSILIDLEKLGSGFWNLQTESVVDYDRSDFTYRWTKHLVKDGTTKPSTYGDDTAMLVDTMEIPDRWSDRTQPTTPQHGRSYRVDEPVSFEDTTPKADEMIDSNWWNYVHCTHPPWTGPIDEASYRCEGTVDAIHVQKWKDGRTTEQLHRFEVIDDEPADTAEPPAE